MINIEENYGLVGMVARRYHNRAEYEDLFQEGCVGLLKACKGFDESLGLKFSTYAAKVIQGAILVYLRDRNDIIRVSRRISDISTQVNKLLKEKITEEEISKILNLTLDDIEGVKKMGSSPMSLDYEMENGNAISNLISTEQSSVDELSFETRVAIDKLKKQERDIIHLRFTKGYTQVETGEALGMRQVMVSRKEKVILNKLKQSLT